MCISHKGEEMKKKERRGCRYVGAGGRVEGGSEREDDGREHCFGQKCRETRAQKRGTKEDNKIG